MGKNLTYSVICLSHLRWDFVYQRPQHILSRFAKEMNVYFFEEPIFSDEPTRLDVSRREDNLHVVVPRISHSDREQFDVAKIQREMLDGLIESESVERFIAWFYTPMAMDFADHLQPSATVFDCMDELSAFKFAPPELIENEVRLLRKADVVFTGGQSLYEAKMDRHKSVFPFPSSIDAEHFQRAREVDEEPADERWIPHPRFGYCGVIDERMDLELLDKMAQLRPNWHFVMIGPVFKIAEQDLPRHDNIHYLGGKNYADLPSYLAGWDVALMPFAMNDSTKFISPTKTPEYLATGLPVVSSPIRDVVRPYGELGLVQIASTAEEFVAACERALTEMPLERLKAADEFLSLNSWDRTFSEMVQLIEAAIQEKSTIAPRVSSVRGMAHGRAESVNEKPIFV